MSLHDSSNVAVRKATKLFSNFKNLNKVLRSEAVQLARIVDNLTDHLKSWNEDSSDSADSTSSSE